ncbi:MAG: ribosomal-processing cysteine protease Prp [Oscillospiraceae bacterium]|nr:ribosomal-processing cysteine protease Prp [Candidatus Ruminococcus equi]
MIKVTFFGNENIKGFKVIGHSDYSEQGSDIVCSAVSSAVYMTANTITDVLKAKADIKVSDGSFCLMLNDSDIALCSSALEGLRLHLLELSKQYQKYITVTISEV